METKFLALTIGLISLAVGPNIRAAQPPSRVYYGEVTSETADAITLNVAPCDKDPNLQTVSPYKKVGSEQASCHGGKKYTRTAVETVSAANADDKKDDKKEDKSKKQPKKSADEQKDKKTSQ